MKSFAKAASLALILGGCQPDFDKYEMSISGIVTHKCGPDGYVINDREGGIFVAVMHGRDSLELERDIQIKGYMKVVQNELVHQYRLCSKESGGPLEVYLPMVHIDSTFYLHKEPMYKNPGRHIV